MKKILFVAAAATLLAAGCQKTEVINPVSPTGEPAMSFTPAMSKLTKAVGTADADQTDGIVNLRAQDFKVWAYKAYADAVNGDVAGQVYDEMEALDVTCGESGSWTTTKDYYWPGTDKALDFFAVSTGHTWAAPALTDEGGNETTPAVDGVSVDITGQGETVGARELVVSGYGVDASNPNDDLMVAEFVRQDQSMNEKKVSVHFKHALAKVQFRFTTNAGTDKIEVKSLVVKGLNTTGTLTVTENGVVASNNGRVPVAMAWTDHGTPADFTDDKDVNLELKAPQTVTEGETTTVVNNDQEFATWLVLPQTIGEKTVTIAYDITSTTGTRNFEQTFALTRPAETDAEGNVVSGKEAFAEWKINQVVIYTINLSPNKITFDPSVEPWDEAENLTDQN